MLAIGVIRAGVNTIYNKTHVKTIQSASKESKTNRQILSRFFIRVLPKYYPQVLKYSFAEYNIFSGVLYKKIKKQKIIDLFPSFR
jgi:hypothetical protein